MVNGCHNEYMDNMNFICQVNITFQKFPLQATNLILYLLIKLTQNLVINHCHQAQTNNCQLILVILLVSVALIIKSSDAMSVPTAKRQNLILLKYFMHNSFYIYIINILLCVRKLITLTHTLL